VYPGKAAMCAVRVALFSWRFVIPLTLFVFCYWQIVAALRRTSSRVGSVRHSVSVGHRDQQHPSTSAAAAAAAAAEASNRSNPRSKTQLRTSRRSG